MTILCIEMLFMDVLRRTIPELMLINLADAGIQSSFFNFFWGDLISGRVIPPKNNRSQKWNFLLC